MRRRRRGQSEISIPEVFAEGKRDYKAAQRSRFRKRQTGVAVMGSGADYHYRNLGGYLAVIELARAFDRDDVIVGQGVTRLIDNVLQQGIKVDQQTGNDDLDVDLKQKWDEWASNKRLCDKSARHAFDALSRLVLRHTVVDGDIIVLPSDDGSLELVEAHRLRRPNNTTRNVVHGVLLNEFRRPIEYWLTKEDLNPNRPLVKVGDVKQYPAWDDNDNPLVFHVYDPKRISQTRGVSAFVPIADTVGMHDDIQFAKLVQQQVVSCFAFIRERLDQDGVYGEPAAMGEQSTQTLADGTEIRQTGIGPGMELIPAPGEKITGFSPNVPNPEFLAHAKLILTFIAVNLQLPVAVLLLDPSETNFSGWRGAMDQARMGFRRIQKWMIEAFYRPVYLWKVRGWLREDSSLLKLAAIDGVDPYGHRFSPPSWPYIEPFKDAKADAQIVKTRLNSRRGVLNRRGLDLDDIDRETIADSESFIGQAIEAADRLNDKYPDARVDWHEVAGITPVETEDSKSESDKEDERDTDDRKN